MHGHETAQADATAAGLPAGPEAVILTFDRQTHPDPADRARAWQAATSVSMETVFADDDLDGLDGSVSVLPIGPFLLAGMSLSAGTALRRRETRVEWEHDHVILDLIVKGSLTGSVGTRQVALGAGDCVVIDLRGGMRLRLRGVRYIGLVIPRSMLVSRVGTAATLNGLIFGAATANGRVLGSLLASLAAEARHLAPRAAQALAQATLDVLASCLVPSAAVKTDQRGSARKPTLAQLRRFIDRHAACPDFGPDALCSNFGLSRAALYRIFASAGGVAEAVRRRRAALAVQRLTQPEASSAGIAEIAKVSGFGTERSMRNALQDLYAASPRDIMRGSGRPMVEREPIEHDIGRLFDTTQQL